MRAADAERMVSEVDRYETFHTAAIGLRDSRTVGMQRLTFW